MNVLFLVPLALVAVGVLVHAAVRRQAVLAAFAAVAFLGLSVVWAGETFGFVNV